jgi:hypothetical protein
MAREQANAIRVAETIQPIAQAMTDVGGCQYLSGARIAVHDGEIARTIEPGGA